MLQKTSFLLLLTMITSTLAFDYGDINPDYLPANPWIDVQYQDPGGWKTVDVTTEGVTPGDRSRDLGPVIEEMINTGDQRTIYYFPEGTYYIRTKMEITVGDFQIVGDGPEKTVFFLDVREAYVNGFKVSGTLGDSYLIGDLPVRGQEQITITSSHTLKVGDIIGIQKQFGNKDSYVSGQLFKIIAVDGGTISLDMKVGMDYRNKQNTDVYAIKHHMLENIRMADFKIYRSPFLRQHKCRNILAENWNNFEVKNIESEIGGRSHIVFSRCRMGLVTGCFIHGWIPGTEDLIDKNGNPDQGNRPCSGLDVVRLSTRVNCTHNRMQDMRHMLITQLGANHCVFAYNTTSPTYLAYQDFGEHNHKRDHNNLWEGNRGAQIIVDRFGFSGIDDNFNSMFYRNYASEEVGTRTEGANYCSIIGNVTDGSISDKADSPPINAGANVVKGTVEWGDYSSSSNLPPSLYRTTKPDFLPRWPMYGPDVDFDPTPAGRIAEPTPVDPPYLPEEGTLNPVFDGYIGSNNYVNIAYTMGDTIQITNRKDDVTDFEGVMKFDLRHYASITSAQLVLVIVEMGGGSDTRLAISELGSDSVYEETICMANLPELTEFYNKELKSTREKTIDVTDRVAAQMSGDKAMSFHIHTSSAGTNRWYRILSKESGDGPKLVVEGVFDPVAVGTAYPRPNPGTGMAESERASRPRLIASHDGISLRVNPRNHSSVRIVSQAGRVVHSCPIAGASVEISTKGIAPGVYFVEIQGRAAETLPLVIQR